MKHLETMNKVSEPSLDESQSSDIYEDFDEDGNRIAVIESEEEEQSWSYGTVQPPPSIVVEGGTVCIFIN